jgi:hypothetical protein
MNQDINDAINILKSIDKAHHDMKEEAKAHSMKEEEKSMHDDEEDEEMQEKGYKDKKNKSIDSDSANKTDVPEDLSSIFANPPKQARRATTGGKSPISLNLFRGKQD